MPFSFPQIDPYAPPLAPDPSAFGFRPRPTAGTGQPLGPDTDGYNAAYDAFIQGITGFAPDSAPMLTGMPGMEGVRDAGADFRNTAMGLYDRNAGGYHRVVDSPEYYGALTSGGTGEQSDRFSQMFANMDQQAASLARQDLASDPRYGGQFAPQGDPTVSQFAAPQQPAAGPITQDTISQMLNLGQIDGRASGVSLSPQQTSAALQNRLDDRADREAFNQRKFSVSPFAGADPTKVLGMMYEAALAEQEMQARMQEMAQKERMARWLGEQELGLKRDELGLRERGIDADIANNAALMGLRQDEFGLNRQKTQAEIAAMGREDRVAPPLSAAEEEGMRQNLIDTKGPIEGEKEFQRRLADIYQRRGYRPPGMESGGGGVLGSLASMLGFGGSAKSPASASPATPVGPLGALPAGAYSLAPRQGMMLPEGKDASAIYGDPWANYEDFYKYAVPDNLKDKLDPQFGSAGMFGGGMFNTEPLTDLDMELGYVRGPDGNPLTESQKSAIRRHFFGWGSGADVADSTLYY